MLRVNNSDIAEKIEAIREKMNKEVEKYYEADNLSDPALAERMRVMENEIWQLNSRIAV